METEEPLWPADPAPCRECGQMTDWKMYTWGNLCRACDDARFH